MRGVVSTRRTPKVRIICTTRRAREKRPKRTSCPKGPILCDRSDPTNDLEKVFSIRENAAIYRKTLLELARERTKGFLPKIKGWLLKK